MLWRKVNNRMSEIGRLCRVALPPIKASNERMADCENHTDASVAEAKNELARRGMPFSEEYFIRCVKGGSADAVQVYLRAGISPNATLDGESALATSANHGHRLITKLLLSAGADPVGLVDGLKIGNTTRDA